MARVDGSDPRLRTYAALINAPNSGEQPNCQYRRWWCAATGTVVVVVVVSRAFRTRPRQFVELLADYDTTDPDGGAAE